MPGFDDPTRSSAGDTRQPSSYPVDPSDPTLLRPGQHVGQFTITRLLGTGGMGAVYEAMQAQPARPVALKVMRAPDPSPSALRRFRDEAQLLAGLSHPAIAQVYEAGAFHPERLTTQAPYYAMELVRDALGITSYASRHSLTQEQSLALMIAVCRAVGHAHSHGVIHRDLKPSNILVDREGNPKIIDFGIARSLGSERDLTLAGNVVGTLAYMSPEQASGTSVDERSDVYTLGLILYEMLCGRPPYSLEGLDFPTAVSVIRSCHPRAPSGIDPRLAGGAAAILAQALQKEPGLRYPDATALADDLASLVAGEVPGASRRRWTTAVRARGASFARRAPRGCAAAAGLAAVLFSIHVVQPFTVGQTSLNARFEHLIAASSPHTAGLSHVRVIAIQESDEELIALAARSAIEPIDPGARGGLRALHGALMARLASAHPSVVVWDSEYPEIGPEETTVDMDAADRAYLAGVRALREKGIDTVVAPVSWAFDPGGLPDIDPVLRPHVRWGCSAVTSETLASYRVAVAVQTGMAEPRPGLALQALVSAKHPGSLAHITLDDPSRSLGLEYYTPDPSRPEGRRPLGIQERIEVSQLRVPAEDVTDTGLQPNDLIAEFTLDLPGGSELDRATSPLASVLSGDAPTLEAMFRDRVVLIGDRRTNRDSEVRADGTRVWRPHLHAVAIDRMLGARAIRFTSPSQEWGSALVAAAVGGLVGWRLKRMAPTCVGVVALVVASVFASAAVYWYAFVLSNPAVPSAASALSAFAAAWISSRYARE